ncbi:Starch-binding associating with outer membrane [Chitinophaga sp. CF118]|uniref:SusD/RagB family nutrient-binding outer membrane lipoprotein n=1 Tax=Chitinophaga sp. CF118 TaxID=1884367 RepID=UPI0008EFB10B|nr:SusD/RagB family nutrient-binding outer membrane lipoprotein [Chitinophaga sp. CF118]SFD29511.1 Starch-binding associating with outer membrane [Chitinophaga sp. CF118]
MKKTIIILSLPFVLLASSCSKFVEGYDKDPNSPSTATPQLVLSAAELGLYSSYTGQLSRTAGILTQQLSGTASQQLAVDKYSIFEGDNTNDWNNIYNNVIQPANDIIINYGEKNIHYTGVAKIIKAMGLGLATDIWGDVPAKEAGMGLIDGNVTPKYETQEEVYAYIQTLLDEAITALNSTDGENLYTLGKDDYIFGSDGSEEADIRAKWVNTAWLLKARFANHLSKKNPSGSATEALADLSHVTDLGDANAIYGTATNEQNQWAAFAVARENDLRDGAYFINLLKTNSDPRLPFYATKATDGTYTGAIPSSENTDASNVGPYLASSTAPVPLVTYVEALFIKAEASLRAGNTGDAATAYNSAVTASVTKVTGAAPSAAFTLAYASETALTITLEKIMTQKYLALFTQVEVWSDWRRTNIPALTPNVAEHATAIPRRLPTVQDEKRYNAANVIIVTDIFAPVWWDL